MSFTVKDYKGLGLNGGHSMPPLPPDWRNCHHFILPYSCRKSSKQTAADKKQILGSKPDYVPKYKGHMGSSFPVHDAVFLWWQH